MTLPFRVRPAEIWPKVLAGQAFLVCAYEDPDKFLANHFEGAMSMAEFLTRLPTVMPDQEIVFYCA